MELPSSWPYFLDVVGSIELTCCRYWSKTEYSWSIILVYLAKRESYYTAK